MNAANLRVISTDLPNGEVMVEVHDGETRELINVKIACPAEGAVCADCGRTIGHKENCFGIGGKLYCIPCGDVRVQSK